MWQSSSIWELACSNTTRSGGLGLDRSDTEIVGLNPAQGMDVRPRLSVLCCPVYVEALRRADHPSKESYQGPLRTVELRSKQVKNKIYVNEGVKTRSKSATVCYHSVQNRLSSCLFSKSLTSEI
jgi:hypothetical protein